MKQYADKIGIALMALAAAVAAFAVWWWALAGMNERVGTAWGVTCGGVFVIGLITWAGS